MVGASWTPVPRVQIIPAGWEEAHRPLVTGTMTARVRYWSGSFDGEPETVYDPATRTERVSRGRVLYDVIDGKPNARIQQHDTPILQQAGEQQVSTHRYLVVVPHDWDEVTLHGWIEVLSSSDGDLTGDHRWMRVIDMLHGSLRWERDLICTINLG